MGQGNSKQEQQQQEKSESAERVDSVESNEDDDMSKLGSLKKNKWLRQKPSEEKPKKNKKNDKKKKKKDETEEVSSATCISDPDRASLRHSRIELHLEECQPAPDEDDAISLSSCGEDLQKNLKDIENEEAPNLLNCDNSNSSMTASPGESLSSGQDSGFARGNTIHSVSSEEEHAEPIPQPKENSSEIGTKLITPTVEVTEKCKDYIEKSYPFNSCSPIQSPVNSIPEEETNKDIDNGPKESNLIQESACDTVSTTTVSGPKLETQSSITETPKRESQTDIIKDQDLVTGMVKELVDETLESAVEYLTQEYKKMNNNEIKQETISQDNKIEEQTVKEFDEVKEEESISIDNKIEEQRIKELSEVKEQESISQDNKIEEQTVKEFDEVKEEKSISIDNKIEEQRIKELNEVKDQESVSQDNEIEEQTVKELSEVKEQEAVSKENEIEEQSAKELNLIEVTETSDLQEKSKEIEESQTTLSLTPPEPFQDKVSGEGNDNVDPATLNCTEKTEITTITMEEGIMVTRNDFTDSVKQEVEVVDISVEETVSTESANVNNTNTAEIRNEFEELSYSLKLKPVHLEESETEELKDKPEGDADETEVVQNCDSVISDYSLLSNESAISEDSSMKVEVSQSESYSSQIDKTNSHDPEILVETIQKEEEIPACPSPTTDLDAEDSGINDSGENSQLFPLDPSDSSMTENSQSLKDTSSFQLSTPEIITISESENNSTDSSSGSAASPQPSKESKETAEASSSSTTQPIPDSTTGAVFV